MALQHRTAARAFIQAGERILTVRYRDAKGDWFVLPGGGQQPGEDLHSTLRRECREELGISIRVGPIKWVREFITPHHPGHDLPSEFHQVELIFACELLSAPDHMCGDCPDTGQQGFQWLAFSELHGVRFYPRSLARHLIEEGPVAIDPYLGDTQ